MKLKLLLLTTTIVPSAFAVSEQPYSSNFVSMLYAMTSDLTVLAVDKGFNSVGTLTGDGIYSAAGWSANASGSYFGMNASLDYNAALDSATNTVSWTESGSFAGFPWPSHGSSIYDSGNIILASSGQIEDPWDFAGVLTASLNGESLTFELGLSASSNRGNIHVTMNSSGNYTVGATISDPGNKYSTDGTADFMSIRGKPDQLDFKIHETIRHVGINLDSIDLTLDGSTDLTGSGGKVHFTAGFGAIPEPSSFGICGVLALGGGIILLRKKRSAQS